MSDEQSRRLPPYVPYRTFINFIDSLRTVVIPSHIDASVMSSMSGGMRSWLRASLRAMSLIDKDAQPLPALRRLVQSEGEERKKLLIASFNVTYGPLLKDKINLQTTTPQQLKAAFGELGAQGETIEKCLAFLLAFAKDAGLELSSYLLKRATPQRRPRGARNAKVQADGNGGGGVQPPNEQPKTLIAQDGMASALLAKFPEFDPKWTAEVQTKWFEAFERLMKVANG